MAMIVEQDQKELAEIKAGTKGTLWVAGQLYEGRYQSISVKKQQVRFNTLHFGNTTQHVFNFDEIETATVEGRQWGGSSNFGNAAMEAKTVNDAMKSAR